MAALCTPVPRPHVHAPNKATGKLAGQDTSCYMSSRQFDSEFPFFNDYLMETKEILVYPEHGFCLEEG